MAEIRKNQVRPGQHVELRFASGLKVDCIVKEIDRTGTDTCPPSITVEVGGQERKYLYDMLESVHLLGAGRKR